MTPAPASADAAAEIAGLRRQIDALSAALVEKETRIMQLADDLAYYRRLASVQKPPARRQP